MLNNLLILFGKTVITLSRLLNLGNGSTWPGHIALGINKNFVRELKVQNTPPAGRLKIIFIAGTNGKTTTAKLLRTILEQHGFKIFQNESGANLLNGLASTFIKYSTVFGKMNYDFAIFEIDENTLPLALQEMTPDYLLLLNLFRDQLDRYGEVNSIALKWSNALKKLPEKTTLILNADDPQIVFLQKSFKGITTFFGLNDKTLAVKTPQHAVDSTYCLNCGNKLTYKTTYYSHVGDWECTNCGEKRPKVDLDKTSYYPLSGIYNMYNTNASVLAAKTIGIDEKTIIAALHTFKPAFGRQEILEIDSKKIQLFLSKNPASFNQSLRTIAELKAKNLLLILNDRIPDGRDVSWIWDVDFEEYIHKIDQIFIGGDRLLDMALRIKYAEYADFVVDDNLEAIIQKALSQTAEKDTLYILPTYSAMLEVRKILTGKKIL